MLTLSNDKTFQYELLRVIGSSRDRGADVGEVLSAASRIVPGDFESWYQEFHQLAEHVRASVALSSGRHRVSVRNAMFRAATYYRAADFFLHGNSDDPRIETTWTNARACFDLAISLLDVQAERLQIDAGDFRVPAILYKLDDRPRPLLLLLNGFDGSQEEMLHAAGFAALERGFNVLTFEGPGQPSVVRKQGLGFVGEWERVVTPVVSYCEALACVDPARIALLGYSFGGFLAPRAAAFEHRLAALVCVDGVFDVYQSFTSALPGEVKSLLQHGQRDSFNSIVDAEKRQNSGLRWAVEHGCWAFRVKTPYDFIQRTETMTMRGIAQQIQCPVLVCDAADDHTFGGQPEQLAEAIGQLAAYQRLTKADAAGEHCHVGASDVMSRVVMDWLEETLDVSSWDFRDDCPRRENTAVLGDLGVTVSR